MRNTPSGDTYFHSFLFASQEVVNIWDWLALKWWYDFQNEHYVYSYIVVNDPDIALR